MTKSNLSRLMEKTAALQGRIFQRVFDAAEIARFSAEKRYEYEESLKAYRDWNNSLDTAKNKAIAIGWEKGRKEEKIAIAKAMKKEGLPVDSIQRMTGLTEEDMKEL